MAIRVTRTNAEVAGTTDPDIRITRTMAEVAGTTGADVRVTRTGAEVAGTVAQPDARIFRVALLALVEAAAITVIDRTATSTVTFTQSADRQGIFSATASSTLTFVQTNGVTGVINLTATSDIIFSDSHVVASPLPLSASNTVAFTQTINPGLFSRTASNGIVFSQSNVRNIPGEKILTASNSLTFTHTAASGLLTRTAYNTIVFDQIGTPFEAEGTVVVTASNTLALSQSSFLTYIKVGAIGLTATHTVNFTARAIFPIELTASDTITFTQAADGVPGKSVEQTLELVQTVVANLVRARTASHTLNLQQSFTGFKVRNGVVIPLGAEPSCGIERQYAPFMGGNVTGIHPTPPAMNRQTDVELFFPSTAQCNPTYGLTLRTPNFGDRDRNQYNRINRESRGGSLRIFRDPKWPSQRTLVMDFSAVKDTEVDGILSFLENTLGQKVGFRDWNGRQWAGIIVNPDSPVVRNGVDRNDVSLELEVDAESFDYQICSVLALTQSASVELIPV